MSGPPAPPAEHLFRAGDRLGGRFAIVQFLARGGMGEVYEAADEHLQDRHCALKVIRLGIAADPIVRQRFEREVLLAREVVHPNVCPTYDLFREESPAGPLLFFTMKLLRGESLAARLNRTGAMAPEASLPLARQMAAALDAAHKAGVIHRDLKPGNVMLEGAGAETRVSITDFGLSRLYESDSTLAQTGRLSGTVGYIAPELLQGRIATPAADVYAFGVVLHEMLTGSKPHGKTGAPGFVRPNNLVQGLPRAWDRVILGCLEYDPAKRFQSAGEAMAALDRTSTASHPVTFRGLASRRHMLQAAAATALVAAAGSWLARPRIEAWLHPLPDQRIVALLAWPAEPDPAARSPLRPVLDAIGNRLVRAEPEARRFAVFTSADLGPTPPKALADVQSAVGANLVLGVSIGQRSSEGLLRLRIFDAASGRVLRERDLPFSTAQWSLLAGKASIAAAELLEVPARPSSHDDRDELAGLSASSYRLFGEAEDLRSQPNDAGLDGAIEKYQAVLDREPRFALGYASLSSAYSQKFRRTADRAFLSLAGKNADLALQYNPDSARALLASAVVSVSSGKAPQALDDLSKALQIAPGNPQVLIFKAIVYRNLARSREEEAVYREIIHARPNFWRAYNELGWCLYRQQRYQDAYEAFGEAAALAPRVALPVANQGAMCLLMGRDGDAADAFQRSLERAPTELAYSNLGTLAFKAADYRKALELYGQARDLNPKAYATWRNMADCYAMLGDTKQELESYGKAAMLLSESLKTNPRSGANWATLAFYHAKLGLRAEAGSDLKTAEDRGLDRGAQFIKVQVLAVLGRKEEALNLLLKCIDQGLSLVDVELALDLKELRADPRYRGRTARREPRQ